MVKGGAPVVYRLATADDTSALVEFQLAMAWETERIQLDPPVCALGVRGIFDKPTRGLFYVGVSGSRVVGSALTTYEWSDWRNGTVWWIQSVYVLPEFRRQRVYAGLYDYIQGLAESDPGVLGIRLYVDRRNTIAHEVYKRLGMNGEHYQVFEWMKRPL
jgi:GNAT superfamily N-acetyltransferase